MPDDVDVEPEQQASQLAERLDRLGEQGHIDGALMVKWRLELLEELVLSPTMANVLQALWQQRLERVVEETEARAARDKLTEGITVDVPRDLSRVR